VTRRLTLSLLLAAAALLAYHNSFQGQFLFDDIGPIVGNPALARLWPFHPDWFASPQDPLTHRPLVRLSLAFNDAIGGLQVWGYHAFNLLVHLAAGLTLFGLIRRTLLQPRLPPGMGRCAEPLALAAALLWLVHPVQTHCVTFVIRRAEAMVGLFYLLTLYGLARCAVSDRPTAWRACAVVSCALGMMTKEVMVTCPVAALLYDRIFLSSGWRELWRKRGGLHAGLAATWGVLALLIAVEPPVRSAGLEFPTLSFRENLLTQLGLLAYYLRLSLWPHPLVLDYDWPVARGFSEIAPQAAVTLLLGTLTLWLLRRQPALGFLGVWFFLPQVPTTLLVIPREIAAEHRLYLPLAGISVAVVLATFRLLQVAFGEAGRPPRRALRTGAILVAAAALALTGLTIRRNRDYHDPVAMWRDTIAKRPLNASAHYNLGVVLLRQARYAEAVEPFLEAVRIRPGFAEAYVNLAFAYGRIGRPVEAQICLGVARGIHGDYPNAIAHFQEALRLDPQNPQARKNLEAALRLKEQVPPR